MGNMPDSGMFILLPCSRDKANRRGVQIMAPEDGDERTHGKLVLVVILV
jgi:hypothetical protein